MDFQSQNIARLQSQSAQVEKVKLLGRIYVHFQLS